MSWIPAFARLAEALAKRAGMTSEDAGMTEKAVLKPSSMSASRHPTERKAARISFSEKPSFKQRAMYSFSSICQDMQNQNLKIKNQNENLKCKNYFLPFKVRMLDAKILAISINSFNSHSS